MFIRKVFLEKHDQPDWIYFITKQNQTTGRADLT